jgi:hypothetical protein
MIYVSVQLWPNGDRKHAKEIGSLSIWNESNLVPSSNYGYDLQQEPTNVTCSPGGSKLGRITGFRRTKQGVFDLIYRVLWQAGAGSGNGVFDR